MKTLPQNEFAEKTLLGLLLTTHTTLDELKSYGVSIDHFHCYRRPFEAVSDFLKSGGGDISLMVMRAHEMGNLDEIGGPAFFMDVTHTAVTGNLIPAIKTVRRCHGERLLIKATNMMQHDPRSQEAIGLIKKGDKEIKDAEKITERVEFDETASMDVFQPTDEKAHPLDDMPFQLLGMDDGVMHYMPNNGQHVVTLAPSQHTKLNFLQLADLHIWEEHFPQKNGADWDAVANWLIQTSQAMPKFDARRIRGRGCWIDGNDVVYHAGDSLAVNAQSMPIPAYDSPTRSIYEGGRAIALEVNNPAKNSESARLLELCDTLTWDNQLSGKLLAGWIALAPICGALNWRPHIWVTGSAGTGKTWIMGNIVAPMVGKSSVFVQGNTSEAGIRGQLRSDALPVLFDEAEAENQRGIMRMEAVMELARQASSESGAGIVKGTQTGGSITYMVRSMFAFSSIGVAAVKKADTSRISVLSLIKSNDPAQFAVVKAIWKETTADPKYCERIRARSINNAITIRDNAEIFSAACVEFTGDKRSADQIGTLLAGAFSLSSKKRITPEAAHFWLSQQDWSQFKTDEIDTDEHQCLAHLLAAEIRIEREKGFSFISIGEAIESARDQISPFYDENLQRIGIKIDDSGVYIANSHQGLERIFAGTAWEGAKWRGQFLRISGAKSAKSVVRYAGNVIKRAVFVPFSAIFR